jgi:hypothetical protein
MKKRKRKMGKTVSFWISRNEEKALEAFCKKHNCTQYAVFRTALLRLLKSKAKNINIPKKILDEDDLA